MAFSYTPEELKKKEDKKKARTARLEQKNRLIQELHQQLSDVPRPTPWSLAQFQLMVKESSSFSWGSVDWAFSVLGIKKTIGEKEAKSIFMQWLKSLHPDRCQLHQLPYNETQEASAILNEAWSVIKKSYFTEKTK